MPHWLTDPLIRADDVDKPTLGAAKRNVHLPVNTGGGRGTGGFNPEQSKAFLGGALEGNTSPLDAILTGLPWGRLAKAAKSLPAAVRGLQKASQTTEQIADPLMDSIKATQTGPFGPKPFRPVNEPPIPSSARGLGLEVERRIIEGQMPPRRKLLPAGG